MNRLLVVLIVFIVQLNAKCIYIDCSGSVSSATNTLTTKLNDKYTEIGNKMDRVRDLYEEKKQNLITNNEISANTKTLKKEFLIVLKEIKTELSKKRNMK